MKIIKLSPHVDCWNNKHSRCSNTGYIMRFLHSIVSDVVLIVPHGDGLTQKVVCLSQKVTFPDYDRAETEYSKCKNVAMAVLCSRKPYNVTLPLIHLPLDDDIFEFGLSHMLRADNVDLPWEERKSIAFWRGVAWPFRYAAIKELHDFPLADVKSVLTPWGKDSIEIDIKYFDKRYNGVNGRPVPLSEHMNFKYILIMDGRVIASALQWVFGSGAVPILITDPGNVFWFKEELKPDVNCVMVNPHDEAFGDTLRSTIRFLVENDEKAKEIAASARELSDRIFTPDFQRKYLLDQIAKID